MLSLLDPSRRVELALATVGQNASSGWGVAVLVTWCAIGGFFACSALRLQRKRVIVGEAWRAANHFSKADIDDTNVGRFFASI